MCIICRFSDITDDDLERIILDIKESMPEIGERMTMGALRSRGIIVPRHRVRQMLHKVDPISSALRWHSKTKRKLNVIHTQYQDQIRYGILVRMLFIYHKLLF